MSVVGDETVSTETFLDSSLDNIFDKIHSSGLGISGRKNKGRNYNRVPSRLGKGHTGAPVPSLLPPGGAEWVCGGREIGTFRALMTLQEVPFFPGEPGDSSATDDVHHGRNVTTPFSPYETQSYGQRRLNLSWEWAPCARTEEVCLCFLWVSCRVRSGFVAGPLPSLEQRKDAVESLPCPRPPFWSFSLDGRTRTLVVAP